MIRAYGVLAVAIIVTAGCELVADLSGERYVESNRKVASAGGASTRDDASVDTSGGRRGDSGNGSTFDASRSSGGSGGATATPERRDASVDGSMDAATSDAGSGGSAGDGAPIDGGPGPPGPSCASMKGTECSGESCCLSLLVNGGTFKMGRSTIDGGTDNAPGDLTELPEHPVMVSTFRLDKFEVTVGRFRRFFDAYDGTPPMPGAGANPRVPDSGWNASWSGALITERAKFNNALFCPPNATWTSVENSNERLPMNCLTWYEAFAFCAWDGGRLPTEAEWEYAASGGPENRLYPWGAEIPAKDGPLAVMGCPQNATLASCFFPVGSKPAGDGRYGQADLAGSMYEFVLDWFDPTFYSKPAASGRDVADLSPPAPTLRMTRGGSYEKGAEAVRAASRNPIGSSGRFDGVGFRCARDP